MSARRWPSSGQTRARLWLTFIAIFGLLPVAAVPVSAAPSGSKCQGPDEWPSNPDRLAREIATACNAVIVNGSADRKQLSEAYNMLAISLNILGLRKGILHFASKAIENSPRSEVFFSNRAQNYINEGSIELAIADAKVAIGLDSTKVTPLIRMGVAESKLGKDDEAISYFRRAVSLNKDHPLGHLELGEFYVNRGRPRQSIDSFMRSENLARRRSFGQEGREWSLEYKAQSLAGRCRALAMLGESDAGSVCDQALRESSTSVNAQFGKGVIFSSKGEDETALSHFDAAIKGDPFFSEAIVERGRIYERKGDLARARQEYERAIERKPKDAWGYLAQARLFETNGQSIEARQSLTKALELQPRLPQVYNAIAAFHERRNETDEAVASYTRSLELDPSNSEASAGLSRFRNQTATK